MRQIIDLVRSGRAPWELAKEFEPSAQTILNRLAQADQDAGARHDGPSRPEQAELRRLRREDKRLREEREILSNRSKAIPCLRKQKPLTAILT